MDEDKGEIERETEDERTEASEGTFQRLKRFNLLAGVFHLVQAVLMVALSNDFTIPVTRGYLEAVVGANDTFQGLNPATVEIFEVRLGLLVASFLFMSSIAHFLIATVLFDNYTARLDKGMNRYRWYEYSVSASVMIVAIAMLTGIYDIGTLLLIGSMNAMMILFGLRMEVHNQLTAKVDWRPFIYGSIAGAIPWVVIAIHLLGAGGGDGGPPTFVYYIYISIAVFFNCFAINMVLQYKQIGKWRDYLFGERMYIVLSLVAKSVLAWQVFAGTLRPG